MNNFYHYGLKSFIHGYVEGSVARTEFHCVTLPICTVQCL